MDEDEVLDVGGGGAGEDLDQRDLDRYLAMQPNEPPTPAEQAARDDNDALGDR